MNQQKPSHIESRFQQALGTIVFLSFIVIVLGATVILLWTMRPTMDLDRELLLDPLIREEVVDRLAKNTIAFYDSHVDADVGRVHVSGLDGVRVENQNVITNRFGMREYEYEIPKSNGTIRIVLLGDSFVYGLGVNADDRMGVILEQELKRRSTYKGAVEVLHLGVSSWNFKNQTAFLRRQLSELKPDVVLHLSLPNDIEDGIGVRGLGLKAQFSPQARERADSILSAGYPISVLGFSSPGYVRHGIDFEGRHRYKESAELLMDLYQRIESIGGKYRLILHYRNLNEAGLQFIGRELPNDITHYVGNKFALNRDYWLSESDHHWNPSGHRRFARSLYELLRRDNLVPVLNLPEWSAATKDYRSILEAGRTEIEGPLLTPNERLVGLRSSPIVSKVDFTQLDDLTAA